MDEKNQVILHLPGYHVMFTPRVIVAKISKMAHIFYFLLLLVLIYYALFRTTIQSYRDINSKISGNKNIGFWYSHCSISSFFLNISTFSSQALFPRPTKPNHFLKELHVNIILEL